MQRAIFDSVMAKLDPTQVRGPIPKGKNAARLFLIAAATYSENLCGLN